MAKKEGTGKKERVVGYVSPNVKRMIQKAVECGDFASESDFVSEAVIKLAYEWQAKREKRIATLE